MRGPVNPFSKESKEEPQKPRKPDLNVLIYIYTHGQLSFLLDPPSPSSPACWYKVNKAVWLQCKFTTVLAITKPLKSSLCKWTGGALYASPVIPPFFNFFFFSPLLFPSSLSSLCFFSQLLPGHNGRGIRGTAFVQDIDEGHEQVQVFDLRYRSGNGQE